MTQHPYKYYAKNYGFNERIDLIDCWDGRNNPKRILSTQRTYKRSGYNDLFLGKISPMVTTSSKEVKKELDLLRGKNRVWFLFSHNTLEEESPILGYANTIGKEIDSFVINGNGFLDEELNSHEKTSLYLYDFSIKNTTQKSNKLKGRKGFFRWRKS